MINFLLGTELEAGQAEGAGASSEDLVDVEMEVEPYDRADLEHLFTTLYCYSNLLSAVLESNSSDHFRFIQFIKQV